MSILDRAPTKAPAKGPVPWPFPVRSSLSRVRPTEIRESRSARGDAIFRRLLISADLLTVAAAVTVLAGAGGESPSPGALMLAGVVALFAKLTGRYDHDQIVLRKSTLDEMPQLIALTAVSTVASTLVTGGGSPVAGFEVGTVWLVVTAALILGRAAARWLAARVAPAERVLIIGNADARVRLATRMASDPFAHIHVVGFLPLVDEPRPPGPFSHERRSRPRRLSELQHAVDVLRVERVLLVPDDSGHMTREAVARANACGVKLSICPSLFDVVGSAVELDEVGGLAVLSQRLPGLTRSSKMVKRAVDVGISLLLLILLAPLMLVVALIIRMDSPGPVLFRQRRVGRLGREFRMLKFRTMVDGAESLRETLGRRNETEGLFKLSSDPRVTHVGRWLRRTSIDEVPQLINVLRGEMSLVGPRPLVPDEDQLVEGGDRVRLDLPPGVTGPWQVLGPNRPPLGDMVKIDYLYAVNWSLWKDIKIMVRTAMHMSGLRGI